MKEVWKDIPELSGRYEVSNTGYIRNAKTHYIVKSQTSNWGYERVRLINSEGKKVTLRVHRIVAKSFIPNPEHKSDVNHKDGNKQNNRADNLEWVTSKENKIHSIKVLRVSPWRQKPIIIQCLETGDKYYSVNSASKETGISSTQLFEHLKGRRSHAGGLHWVKIK